MLKHLKLTNIDIGPGDAQLDFAERVNLITGDNGLGKRPERVEVMPTGQNRDMRHHVQGVSNA
jgi:hypothetical protein